LDREFLRPTVTDDFHCAPARAAGVPRQGSTLHARVGTTPAATVHHALLPEIDLTSPTGATSIWALHLFAKTPDGSAVAAFRHYDNASVKQDDVWKIGSLRLECLLREVQPGQPAT
jgi:hypothetical protein